MTDLPILKKSAPRIFVSGCGVDKLPEAVCVALDRFMKKGFVIMVGDNAGVDTLVQKYCLKYNQVYVYHLGSEPRNILRKDWITFGVKSHSQEEKDRLMACFADYGLAIWDGKDKAIARNIRLVPKTKVISSDYGLPMLLNTHKAKQ